MKIVLVNSEHPSATGLDHGGIATYTYCMANMLANAGNTVHVLSRAGSTPDKLHPDVQFHTFSRAPVSGIRARIPFIAGNQALFEQGFSQSAFELVMELHQNEQIDIVEIPEYNGLAYAFRPPLPFPIVVHLHTPTFLVDIYNNLEPDRDRKKWYNYEKAALLNANGIVSPSQGLRDQVAGTLKLSPERIQVLRHGMPTEVFDAVKVAPHDPEVIHALFCGRLEHRKGAAFLLKTLAEVLDQNPRVHVTIAGETGLGEAHDYRMAIERSLKPATRDRVWFLGPVDSSRLPALYKQSDIFLFPSLFENAPFALLEAMAAHLPVVALDVPGVNEIIRHEETGLLSPTDTPRLFTDHVLRLASDDAMRRRLGNNGYASLQQHYSPAQAVDATLRYYESIIGSHGGSRQS